jgi:hypothetical protein
MTPSPPPQKKPTALVPGLALLMSDCVTLKSYVCAFKPKHIIVKTVKKTDFFKNWGKQI